MHLEFNNPEFANALQDVVSETFKTIWFGWRVWIVLIEARMLIGFFININPYFYPIYYLWVATDVAFNFGRKYYPKLIGYDMCFIVNFTIIMKLETVLDRLAHGIDKYNQFKITGEEYVPKPKINVPIAPTSEVNLGVPYDNTEGLLAISDESNLGNVTSFELAHNEYSHFLFPVDFLHLIHF